MSPKFRNTLIVTFLSSILLIVAFSIYMYNNIQSLVEDMDMVAHTNQVLYSLEQIKSEIRYTENNQRGFLVSGNESFLNGYWGGYARTRNRFDEVNFMIKDNVSQGMRLDTLSTLIDERFRQMDDRFKLGLLPPEDPRPREMALEAVKIMEKIDALINRMKLNEQDLLKYRRKKAQEAADAAYIVSTVFIILTVIIIITSFAFTLNEFQRRARTEKLLHESIDRLNVTNENLEQFAYVASHDLQEPLRKIQAFGDLLKSDYAKDLNPVAVDYIDRMHNAAGRMQVLINDLLNFSRASRNVGEYETINLREKINHVMSDLEITIKDSHTTIDLDIPSSLYIYGTRPQLARLFQNLITNAIKFHKEGEDPVIKIIATRYDVIRNEYGFILDPAKKYIEIKVIDNGIGFDEKYKDKIFTIFQRLHNRVDYKGTGIGLALCKKIVENHKGYITAESVPGEGSTFIVILPTKT